MKNRTILWWGIALVVVGLVAFSAISFLERGLDKGEQLCSRWIAGYAQVTIERWQGFTGREAMKIDD